MDKWSGKSWATLGDSITAANGYQPIVAAALGFARVDNYGKSGCPMTAGGERDAGSTLRVGLAIASPYDCVTIFAGTNDYRLGKPLGTVNSRDELTFYGAYRTVVEHLLSVHPACRISLWTPLQRDKDGYDTERLNDAGCRLPDYAQAVRDIGKLYALPVLDLYEESGFNMLTLDYLTSDRLHPNEYGHKRIASMAISFLQRL
ncbi:SGNH/GDSL hydrolase family protein [Paenibacillus cymbidii]|uniref:SGNH/GDSL hydrolase family protein n=1 Tax=Paenibacillus cymbidii TaxID=1639034 RepID=UPI0014368D02|nr:SGNH/GDSL hydrolase family protein [Paenibacillus cymbidii]